MITFENAICFLVGLAVVYILGRSLGLCLLFGACLIGSMLHAHTLTVYAWLSDTNHVSYMNFPYGVTVLPLTAGATTVSTADMWNDDYMGYNLGYIDTNSDWVATIQDYEGDGTVERYYPDLPASPAPTDYWPAVSSGMAFGFVLIGFGWKLRMVKRTTGDF
jgi:hypothetical protein